MLRKLFIIALLIPQFLLADLVEFTNGRKAEGTVIRETKDEIVIKSNGIEMTFMRSTVKRIVRSESWENTLLQATSLIDSDPAQAITQLRRAIDEEAPPAEINTFLSEEQHKISSAISRLKAAEKAELSFQFRQLTGSDVLTSTTLFQVSQHFYELEDPDSSAETLTKMPLESLKESSIMRNFSLMLMRTLVDRRLNRGQFDEALQWLETMRRLRTQESEANLPIAHLTSAAKAREMNKFHDAFEVLIEGLQENYPAVARHRIQHTTEAMLDWAEKTGDYGDARSALELIADYYPLIYENARNQLLRAHTSQMLDNGEYSRVIEEIEVIPEPERSASLRRIFNEAVHEQRMKTLDESDPLSLFEHGRWLVENGMPEQANRIFQETRRNANLREVSDLQIANLRKERDTILLERAQESYELGLQGETIQLTNQILNNPNLGSQLEAEARALLKLAEESLARDREAVPYRAEVIFQNAERAFFADRLTEAINLLDVVINNFGETPAAGRAKALRPDVLDSIRIARLEGRYVQIPGARGGEDSSRIDDLNRADQLSDEIKSLMGKAPEP